MTDGHGDFESILASLDALSSDQEQLFDELQAGFPTRADVVIWLHKVSARTLGMIGDDLALEVLGNRYRLAAMLSDPRERKLLSKKAPDDERARRERRMFADDELLEACRDAMKFLGDHADEHVESFAGEAEIGPQRYIAMRPALEDAVRRQRASLKRALGRDDSHPRGLETSEDVSTWVRGVIRAVKGVDSGISRSACWDLYWRSVLTGPTQSPALHLHLADSVLPVMNRTIRSTATAREAVAEDREHHGPMEI